MRTILLSPLLLLGFTSFSQKSPKNIEADLKKQFEKIWYWDEHHEINDRVDTYDSIQRASDYVLNYITKEGCLIGSKHVLARNFPARDEV